MKGIRLKKTLFNTLLILISLAVSLTSCDKESINNNTDISDSQILTELEIEGLNYMREEEKLARDVYLYFYEVYGLQVFNNIANAEQSHMDQIKVLLDKYNLTDPSLAVEGKFSNTTLQELYDALIERGNISLVEALKVGSTIEDVDIYDLEAYMEDVVQEDLLTVYKSLNCGSRIHMRSFDKQLIKNNATYDAQFISQEKYDSIINTNNEQCGQ